MGMDGRAWSLERWMGAGSMRGRLLAILINVSQAVLQSVLKVLVLDQERLHSVAQPPGIRLCASCSLPKLPLSISGCAPRINLPGGQELPLSLEVCVGRRSCKSLPEAKC